MSKWMLCAMMLCSWSVPQALSAQTTKSAVARAVKPGDYVRLVSSPQAERFAVERLTADSLFLRSTGPGGNLVRVAIDSLSTLEVRRTQSRGSGARRGAMVGGVIGAGLGALIGFVSGDDEAGIIALSAGDKAVLLGAVLGVTGVGIGSMAGAASGVQTWEPVALHGGVGVMRMRGGAMAVTYSVAFR